MHKVMIEKHDGERMEFAARRMLSSDGAYVFACPDGNDYLIRHGDVKELTTELIEETVAELEEVL